MRFIDADLLKDDLNYSRVNKRLEIFPGFIDLVDNQPTVEIPQWIPCSERLPEEFEDVLVFYEYLSMKGNNCGKIVKSFGIGYQLHGFWSGDVSGIKSRCIAWQPLPEPYKGE